ncbi:MAG: hypothetical protein DDG58_02950 [Ardenticatenia bacterium]|nr:MAG: hypothetical protein DDG58_02950 [Ardenticatenia bacterium]
MPSAQRPLGVWLQWVASAHGGGVTLPAQEVPHALAVVTDEFSERDEHTTYISATLYVERDSQKRIVIGQDGRMLKAIGQSARQEIEQLLGKHVYLDLWVKVWPKWRKKEAELRRLGYRLRGG